MASGGDGRSKGPKLTLKLRLITMATTRLVSFAMNSSDGTINRRLLDFFNRKVPPSDEPVNGVRTSDVTFDSSSNLTFRLFLPSSNANYTSLPLIVYFHGGGFALFSANSTEYDFICRRIAAGVPAIVASVNYRLAPEHRYPVAYEDCFSALKFIDNLPDASVLPATVDLGRIYLAGDSAGANIAHHMAVRSSEYSFKKLNLVGVIAIQPYFSGEARTESELRFGGGPAVTLTNSDLCWKMFLPEGSDRDHEAANVTGPKSVDLAEVKFPGTLVVIGGYDFLHDSQRRYSEWLRKCGKQVEVLELPGAFHAFYAFAHVAEIPEFAVLIEGIRDFVNNTEE